MWRELTEGLFKRLRKQRTEKARAKFWADVRTGQHEAEAATEAPKIDANDVMRPSEWNESTDED